MKCEITILVCLVVLGDGRYLSDDKESNAYQSDFDFNGVLKGSFNRKSEVDDLYIPEDRLTDNTKTKENEERKRKHKTEFSEGRSRQDDSMVLRARPETKKYTAHVIFAESEFADTKYEFKMVPDHVLYNGYISARSESTTDTTTNKIELNVEDNDKIKEKEQNVDIMPNLQLYGDK